MGLTGCHITFRYTRDNRTGVAYQELERRYYETGSYEQECSGYRTRKKGSLQHTSPMPFTFG
jgi:hypothetical protein